MIILMAVGIKKDVFCLFSDDDDDDDNNDDIVYSCFDQMFHDF